MFTKIINGEVPSYKIYEDEKVFSFLDIRPAQKGHLLLVPKIEVDHIHDLNDEDYAYLYKVARKLSLHLMEKLKCKRVGQLVEGFEVPHAHLHLIPMFKEGDINGSIELTKKEFCEIQELLAL